MKKLFFIVLLALSGCLPSNPTAKIDEGLPPGVQKFCDKEITCYLYRASISCIRDGGSC